MSFTDLTPYSTAKPLFAGGTFGWLPDPLEQERLSAYMLYEKIYWNVPDTFKVMQRGEDNTSPIYVPAGRVIVDTLHRFLANGLTVACDPAVGTPSDQANAMVVWKNFLKRERFFSKFSTNKKEGIFRGDWAWHLFADPLLPDGARISIESVDPASVFPIYNPTNVDEVIGYNIVGQITFDNKPAIQRLQYRKETEAAGPSPITVSDIIFEMDKWGGPGQLDKEGVLQVVTPLSTLPPPIDQLPVYWIPHTSSTGTMYGSSELRGLERIIGALNQTVSDEELALALEGLGVYVTNAGTPIDDDGNDVNWRIYPGGVVELPTGGDAKTFFERKSGISSVEPYNDIQKYLHEQLYDATATAAVARGDVDVTVAESGIALLLRLAPLLSKAGELEQTITDVHVNMFFDLRNWFAAYEPSELSTPLINTMLEPHYGEKIPQNRDKKFEEVTKLYEGGLVTLVWALQELAKMGFDFGDPTTMLNAIVAEKQATGQVEADVTGSRLDTELETIDESVERED